MAIFRHRITSSTIASRLFATFGSSIIDHVERVKAIEAEGKDSTTIRNTY